MIYMWFTGINYYKLAVEKDGDSIFTTIIRPYGNQAYKSAFSLLVILKRQTANTPWHVLCMYAIYIRSWVQCIVDPLNAACDN